MRRMLWLFVFVSLAAAPPAAAQTEIDRLLVRVYGAVITQSDVRQARALKLVPDVSSDEAVQRALENRLLLLRELTTAPPAAAATDEAIAARRRTWEQAIGGDAPTLLARHGMPEGVLTAWLRDDARIEAFLRHQFGDAGDPNRAKALGSWIERLRQRAGLR